MSNKRPIGELKKGDQVLVNNGNGNPVLATISEKKEDGIYNTVEGLKRGYQFTVFTSNYSTTGYNQVRRKVYPK